MHPKGMSGRLKKVPRVILDEEDRRHFHTDIAKCIYDFMPQFEYRGVEYDDRIFDRMYDVALNDECFRMAHITIMEELYKKADGFVAMDPFIFLVHNPGLTIAVPLIRLNDHRAPIGMMLGFSELYELFEDITRFWKMIGIRVKCWGVDELLTDKAHYFYVDFLGPIRMDSISHVCELIQSTKGLQHPVVTGSNPVLLGVPGPKLLNRVDANYNLESAPLPGGWIKSYFCALDLMESDLWRPLEEWSAQMESHGTELRQRMSTPAAIMSDYLMYRQYGAFKDFPSDSLEYFKEFHVLMCFMFDLNFACMFHLHVGSAYRIGPSYITVHADEKVSKDEFIRALRCNSCMVSYPFHVAHDHVVKFDGVAFTGDMGFGYVNKERNGYCKNWHRLYQDRTKNVIVPETYWQYLSELMWVKDRRRYSPGVLSDCFPAGGLGHFMEVPLCVETSTVTYVLYFETAARSGLDVEKELFLLDDMAGDTYVNVITLQESDTLRKYRMDRIKKREHMNAQEAEGADMVLFGWVDRSDDISTHGDAFAHEYRYEALDVYKAFKREFNRYYPDIAYDMRTAFTEPL